MSNNNSYSSGKKLEEITLPYDFISLPKKYIPRYDDINELPKYNEIDDKTQSGYIEYSIEPYSELAVEIRDKYGDDKEKYLSGSLMKGLSRSNAEKLSASFPIFVDRTTLLYRDITNENYKNRLGIKESIEKDINAGFLTKRNNKYYIIPAKEFNYGKHFISIKEHQLRMMNIDRSKISWLYEWKDITMKRMEELDKEIQNLSRQIKNYRKENEEFIKENDNRIKDIFLKKFAFTKKIDKRFKEENLQKVQGQLRKELKKIEGFKEEHSELLDLYVKRWGMKVKVELEYRNLKKNKSSFKPYQREMVNICEKWGNGEKNGILFNSTDAYSKRSHYLIRVEKEDSIYLKDSVVNAYNKNFKKFKDVNHKNRKDNNSVKNFYNIFDGYDTLYKELNSKKINDKENNNNEQLPIVFYKLENKEVVNIGRTPYFKIAYQVQMNDLLNDKDVPGESIDYASALFGFSRKDIMVADNLHNKINSYKSRLRFSPIKISGAFESVDVDGLILLTPQASASGMYLKQDKLREERITYEDNECKLNGYKYYHVLKKIIDCSNKKVNKDIKTKKTCIKFDDNNKPVIKGKIYFKNLKSDELGLLLLSIDITKLSMTKKYKKEIVDHKKILNECYELIGGAKPYGYGKTKIRIEKLMLERKDINFGTLIENSFDENDEYGKYLDSFIDFVVEKKDYKDYFTDDCFCEYLNSKQEVEYKSTEYYNWNNLNIGKGYDKKWILKTKEKRNNRLQ